MLVAIGWLRPAAGAAWLPTHRHMVAAPLFARFTYQAPRSALLSGVRAGRATIQEVLVTAPTPVGPHLRVVRDPRPGQVVECPVASCVEVRFTPGLVSRWRIKERPGHLVPISQGDHHFTFVVFAGRSNSEYGPLRLVRLRSDRADTDSEVEERELHVLPSVRLAALPA